MKVRKIYTNQLGSLKFIKFQKYKSVLEESQRKYTQTNLTLWGLGIHICQHTGSSFVTVMACLLLGAKPLPKPMMTFCKKNSDRKIQWNFNPNIIIFMQLKASENGICRISAMLLTHWGRRMHMCISKLTIIGSDNGLSPGRHQAIIWTNTGILLIGPLGTNFSEILGEIYIFLFRKIHLRFKCPQQIGSQCLSLNVLRSE